MQINVETLILLFSTFFGAGWLGQFFLARYAKEKRQRDIDISKEYLSLADMTADQLEKRLNLIGKLDEDNRNLSNELYLLKLKQLETEEMRKVRDEHFETMEARIAALQAQVDKDARERADLRAKLAEFEVRNRVLWQYIIALLEQFKQHRIIPVSPPKELESDPEIIKLLNDIKDSQQ